MGWPQVTVVALMVMTFTVSALKHGEPKGPWSVVATTGNCAIWAGLLYAGGFFA